MNDADKLLRTLRELVNDSRDEEMPDFFHAIDHGAHLAGAFDDLDKLLSAGGELPAEWRR